tara:strand:- start:1031 stop:1156 length:126 start_codon:yes stop_codon:yes gene_type:complete
MKEMMQIFGILVAGLVIVRIFGKKALKPPKGGRYFKRKMDD